MGEEPRLSAVSGDDDVLAVPSEAPTPLRHSVESSRAAAATARYRDCSRLFRKTVGDRLAFMMDSVELLPLTLIVQIDVTGEERGHPQTRCGRSCPGALRSVSWSPLTKNLMRTLMAIISF